MTHAHVATDFSCQTCCLTLANDASEMPRFYEFIEGLCEKYDYPGAFRMEIQLALEEALVNVINYAHPKESGRHDIKLNFRQTDNETQFVITDDGVPFDPTRQKEVDINAPLEEREVGGLGIHLVRNLMDSMEYRRERGRNVLTLRKRIAQL